MSRQVSQFENSYVNMCNNLKLSCLRHQFTSEHEVRYFLRGWTRATQPQGSSFCKQHMPQGKWPCMRSLRCSQQGRVCNTGQGISIRLSGFVRLPATVRPYTGSRGLKRVPKLRLPRYGNHLDILTATGFRFDALICPSVLKRIPFMSQKLKWPGHAKSREIIWCRKQVQCTAVVPLRLVLDKLLCGQVKGFMDVIRILTPGSPHYRLAKYLLSPSNSESLSIPARAGGTHVRFLPPRSKTLACLDVSSLVVAQKSAQRPSSRRAISANLMNGLKHPRAAGTQKCRFSRGDASSIPPLSIFCSQTLGLLWVGVVMRHNLRLPEHGLWTAPVPSSRLVLDASPEPTREKPDTGKHHVPSTHRPLCRGSPCLLGLPKVAAGWPGTGNCSPKLGLVSPGGEARLNNMNKTSRRPLTAITGHFILLSSPLPEETAVNFPHLHIFISFLFFPVVDLPLLMRPAAIAETRRYC
ncbi:hypothetical protein VP01_3378g1 [Puccinia sorghi]|uniref:Uncharacterized protein n=1 Tax=Puccinia sorghi TaxID=27349 RepID=A0A0L6UYP0_9BASI|nr:hypothetical protein VP01_3378g1 [Puccinia sorghi]